MRRWSRACHRAVLYMFLRSLCLRPVRRCFSAQGLPAPYAPLRELRPVSQEPPLAMPPPCASVLRLRAPAMSPEPVRSLLEDLTRRTAGHRLRRPQVPEPVRFSSPRASSRPGVPALNASTREFRSSRRHSLPSSRTGPGPRGGGAEQKRPRPRQSRSLDK